MRSVAWVVGAGLSWAGSAMAEPTWDDAARGEARIQVLEAELGEANAELRGGAERAADEDARVRRAIALAGVAGGGPTVVRPDDLAVVGPLVRSRLARVRSALDATGEVLHIVAELHGLESEDEVSRWTTTAPPVDEVERLELLARVVRLQAQLEEALAARDRALHGNLTTSNP